VTEGWQWLESTRELQERYFGIDFTAIAADGNARADYTLMNAYAIVDEISEATDEITWKPWAKERGLVNRDAMVGELVDAAHFLANLLCMLGVTDGEWAQRYQEKQRRNVRRQQTEGGYDTRQDKCPGCGRELDKPGAMSLSSGMIRCKACDFYLGRLSSSDGITWSQHVVIKNATFP
jgi:hypothetical protein